MLEYARHRFTIILNTLLQAVAANRFMLAQHRKANLFTIFAEVIQEK